MLGAFPAFSQSIENLSPEEGVVSSLRASRKRAQPQAGKPQGVRGALGGLLQFCQIEHGGQNDALHGCGRDQHDLDDAGFTDNVK
jgi:hypothetical protein